MLLSVNFFLSHLSRSKQKDNSLPPCHLINETARERKRITRLERQRERKNNTDKLKVSIRFSKSNLALQREKD